MITVSQQTADPADQDVLQEIPDVARSAFEASDHNRLAELQRLIRSVAVRLVTLQFQPYQEPVEDLIQDLRAVLLQLAQFSKGDYAKEPAFYLGQIYAFAEFAALVRQQALPREAVQLLGRSDLAGKVLNLVIENRSMSPTELAKQLSRDSQNLVPINEQLVNAGLLQRDEFGRRVRFSPTALALAAAEQFNLERMNELAVEVGTPEADAEALVPESQPLLDSLVSVAAARGADKVEIKPTNKAVVVTVSAKNEKSRHRLPKSLERPLFHQLGEIHRRSGMTGVKAERDNKSRAKYKVHEGVGYGLITIDADEPVRLSEKKQVMRASFHKITTDLENAESVQRFVVGEAVTAFKGKKKAAKQLGINLGNLNQIIQAEE